MPTPPRIIEKLPAQRVPELRELELRLVRAIDCLKLAQLYASESNPQDGADRLERARVEVAGVLEELQTFRAPAPKPKAARKPRTQALTVEQQQDLTPPYVEPAVRTNRVTDRDPRVAVDGAR